MAQSNEQAELVKTNKKQEHDPYAQPHDSDSDDEPQNHKKTSPQVHNAGKKNTKDKVIYKSPKENESAPDKGNDNYFIMSAFIIEAIIVLLYAIGSDYHDAGTICDGTDPDCKDTDHSMEYYSTYQDVHVMMFIGFGFLMTFLRKYGFGSISFNMLITAMALQWGMFCFHWIAGGRLWEDSENDKRFVFETEHLVDGDIAAAAVLISFGAILGRTSPTQLIWMAFFELILFSFNFYICVEELHIVDVGGSIVVHTFGAYFGLAVSWVLGEPKKTDDNKSMYHSDLFAMIGTLFLWIYWPSFNGFFASQEGFYRDRAFINTVLSLSACTMSSFMFSKVFRNGKFDMVHVQNATLAGGVAVGAAADLYIHPAGALGVGIVAGFLSVYGYCTIQDKLEEGMSLWDTCGVHNLHGMPGIMGGIVSAIAIWAASSDKRELYAGGAGCEDDDCAFYYSWGKQGGMQIAAIGVTLGMAIVGGFIIGHLIKAIEKNNPYKTKSWYHDNDNFVVPKGKTTDIFRGTIRGQQFSRDLDDLDAFDDE